MALKGQRIVVLGGSSGIGLATAQAAAREGASVVIASSRKARIDQALATLPAGTVMSSLSRARGCLRNTLTALGNRTKLPPSPEITPANA